jgi:hypothetical protein
MERGCEEIVFFNEDGFAGVFGEDFDRISGAIDDGTANENHFERFGFDFARAEENVAGELTAVGVAENGHVHEAERGLRGILDFGGEENCSGASAENCVAVGSEFPDSVVEALFLEELELCGAFAARED